MQILQNPFDAQLTSPNVRIPLVEPQYVQRSEESLLNFLRLIVFSHQLRQQVQSRLQVPDLFQTEVTIRPFNPLSSVDSPSESAELRWLRMNDAEVSRHRGEWLLIANGGLVAASSDFREIKQAINKAGIVTPFVYYVPSDAESNFTLL